MTICLHRNNSGAFLSSGSQSTLIYRNLGIEGIREKSSNMLYPVIIILTIMAIHESGATWCTDEQHTNCMCDQSDITCNGQPRFTQIPNNIPTSTHRLNLDNNNITSINSTVLSGLTSLNRLSLRNNQISSIDSEAFS
ncbi:Hypothetical predicted protein, partial [Mytilus galloprovincialis]